MGGKGGMLWLGWGRREEWGVGEDDAAAAAGVVCGSCFEEEAWTPPDPPTRPVMGWVSVWCLWA